MPGFEKILKNSCKKGVSSPSRLENKDYSEEIKRKKIYLNNSIKAKLLHKGTDQRSDLIIAVVIVQVSIFANMQGYGLVIAVVVLLSQFHFYRPSNRTIALLSCLSNFGNKKTRYLIFLKTYSKSRFISAKLLMCELKSFCAL